MSDEVTNSVAEEELDSTAAPEVADEANAQGDDQTQYDDDGNPIEDQADDTEEIEHEGAKYKLPKTLAKEFREGLLRQADYTRKTQEVAETRKALEARHAEIAQQAELQAATLDERVTLKSLEGALAQYQQINWQDYTAQYGSDATATAMAQWRQLEAAKTTLEGEIGKKEQEHRLSRERASATALQEADQILAKDIPGYGPELVQSVAKVAHAYGFTPAEVRETLIGADGKADVRSFKLLARLHAAEAELSGLKAKQTKAQQAEKVAQVQPAKTVGQKAGGYKPGLNDELPPEEWLRRRNAQVRKSA